MAGSGRQKKNNGEKRSKDHDQGARQGEFQSGDQRRTSESRGGVEAIRLDLRVFIDGIIAAHVRGGGFAVHATIPDHLLPEDRGPFTLQYLGEAHLLDRVTNIVRAAFPTRGQDVNPTAGVLDDLIARGSITNTDLVADVLSVNARMILTGAADYVPGLGWPRLCVMRTDDYRPILMPPAIRSRDLIAYPGFVVGLWEHEWLYFRKDAAAPLGIAPAYRVTLRGAAAMTGWHASTIYARTSGRRRDWDLDKHRIRTDDAAREIVFEPTGFWTWLLSKRRR